MYLAGHDLWWSPLIWDFPLLQPLHFGDVSPLAPVRPSSPDVYRHVTAALTAGDQTRSSTAATTGFSAAMPGMGSCLAGCMSGPRSRYGTA